MSTVQALQASQRAAADVSLSSQPEAGGPAAGRYVSLDAYRGFIMMLLVSAGLGFGALKGHPVFGMIAAQVDHVPWEGTVFWDLIQPAFMFMVGVAMPFAFARRIERGATFTGNLGHVVWRSLKLIALSHLFGMWSRGEIQFGLINVLSQIAFTYFFCFLIMQLEFRWQALSAGLILAGHTALFVLFPGPDGAFSKTGNIGQVIDLAVLGRTYSGNYVTINFINSTVTTLFGVWTGYLMMSSRSISSKMKIIGIAAAAGMAGGLALAPAVPIVKRIWTASFTLYSAGWVLLMLLAFVWIVEVRGYRRLVFPLVVVGMNSIFVYVIFQMFRGGVENVVGALTGHFVWIGTLAPVAQATATLAVIWYFCYWLYQRKIFFKL
ncbi:MAG: acyltransferase family protein [Bryobacteraceae bacterium]